MRFTVFALVAAFGAATDSVGQEAIVQPIETFEESPVVNVTEDLDAMELGLGTMGFGHHHSSSSSSSSRDEAMSMSMDMSTPVHDDGDYVGDNGEHGMTGCIYQTAEERCAIYQTYLRKTFEFDKQLAGLPNFFLPEVIPEDAGRRLETNKKTEEKVVKTDRNLKLFSKGAKDNKADAIKDADNIETQAVPWYENRNPLCYAACGIRKVCPEECSELSDIEEYCSVMDGHVEFDPNCGFCTDTCRSACISFVAHCCPCTQPKLILNINTAEALEQVLNDELRSTLVADDPAKGPGVIESYVLKEATPKEFGFEKGFGLEFTAAISKYYYSSGSYLVYWCRSSFLGSSMPDFDVVPEMSDPPNEYEAIREGLYKWKYDDDINLSEDLVYFEGLEKASGSVYGKDKGTFKLVFKDSMGWHISENTFDVNTKGTTIRAASPEMLYNNFNPYINDNVVNEAGTTFGPSKPSFNCLDCIGFRLDGVAKKMYHERDLETETETAAGEEGPADIVEQDEEVDEMLWRPKPKSDSYVVYVKKFLVEAKSSTVQWRHLT